MQELTFAATPQPREQMMEKPIATVIREALCEANVWKKGTSKTYKDVWRSRSLERTHWTTKYICEDSLTHQAQSNVKKKLQSLLGDQYSVMVSKSFVAVSTSRPIQIVALDTI